MKIICLTGVMMAFTVGQDNELWLDTMDLSAVSQQHGRPRANRSFSGKPLRIGGRTYERGIGTHSFSEFHIDLKGAALRFEAVVGLDEEVRNGTGSVVFQVFVDGRKEFDSGVMKDVTPAKAVGVDLRGARRLRLFVTDAGDGGGADHGNWAMAKLVLAPGAKEKPAGVTLPRGPGEIRTPKAPMEPRINGPGIYGARPGRPFFYAVPATGEEPIRFSAEGLPEGLWLDETTGRITGFPKGAGTHRVKVTAKNAKGEHSRTLEIAIGDAICLTPPLGWNSWNCWGTSVDAKKIAAAADAMVKSGLAKHGWTYVNIDDAWEGKRDPNGVLCTNEKFPDMRSLAEYVHQKGLKIGIYSSPGPKTCAGYEGSFGHEELDAKTWAGWGIDYVKYDWCSCRSQDLREPYRVMRAALDRCARDIVYSLCQYGMGNVWEWGAEVGGNCWRTTGDIGDSWMSMSGIGFGQNGREKFAGPGHWNDPDMLVVGMVGWGPSLHPTSLTPDEQYTHITLWCLLAAPLLIGCDLTQLDDFTLNLLTNDEVLAVNQDPLGRQGWRVRQDGETEVWMKPLQDGTTAVGLFNLGFDAADVTALWKDLGLSGAQPVRDLWRQKDLGQTEDSFTLKVAPHGTELVRIGIPKER